MATDVNSQRLSPRSSGSRVTSLQMQYKVIIKSDGGGAEFNDWVPVSPAIEGGEDIEDVVIHLEVFFRTANLDIKYRIARSMEGLIWKNGGDVLYSPAANSNLYVISSPYTTRTDFGRFFRIEMGTADSGAVESATVSSILAIKTWSR